MAMTKTSLSGYSTSELIPLVNNDLHSSILSVVVSQAISSSCTNKKYAALYYIGLLPLLSQFRERHYTMKEMILSRSRPFQPFYFV